MEAAIQEEDARGKMFAGRIRAQSAAEAVQIAIDTGDLEIVAFTAENAHAATDDAAREELEAVIAHDAVIMKTLETEALKAHDNLKKEAQEATQAQRTLIAAQARLEDVRSSGNEVEIEEARDELKIAQETAKMWTLEAMDAAKDVASSQASIELAAAQAEMNKEFTHAETAMRALTAAEDHLQQMKLLGDAELVRQAENRVAKVEAKAAADAKTAADAAARLDVATMRKKLTDMRADITMAQYIVDLAQGQLAEAEEEMATAQASGVSWGIEVAEEALTEAKENYDAERQDLIDKQCLLEETEAIAKKTGLEDALR